jgi:hypothetical protein
MLRLTLSEAIKTQRLQDFIAQEQTRGVGPADTVQLEAVIRALATQPQSENQTSHSSSADGSTET